MVKKSNSSNKIVRFVFKPIGLYLIALILSFLLFLVMIPFLSAVDNLPETQKAAVGAQNLWRIVGYYGLATIVIAGLTFYKKRYIFVGIAFITYWVLGTVLVIFINSPTDLQSSSVVSLADWNACKEQDSLQQAKSCSFPINTDKGTGSGFGYRDTYIVTNYHVIEGGDKVWTYTSDTGVQEVSLKVWGYSEKDDIAILKVEKPIQSCSLISSDNIPLAETLYAIGWPIGLEGESSITKGTFSRKYTLDGQELIQTDTAINPGNSGGPLVSRCGVVGINQSIIRWSDSQTPAEGLGFAISSSKALPVINNIVENGHEQNIPQAKQSQSKYDTNNYSYGQGYSSGFSASGYDVNGWINARNTTRELFSFWNSNAVGGYDQGKVAIIRDLLVRMSSVVENIVPKLEKGQSLSSEENRLLGEWNGMYSKVTTLIYQVKYPNFYQ